MEISLNSQFFYQRIKRSTKGLYQVQRVMISREPESYQTSVDKAYICL